MVLTDLAEDKNQWRALVNTVTNLQVSYKLGSSSIDGQLAVSEEEHRSKELVYTGDCSAYYSRVRH
jgi:hypothetical protein